MNVRVDLSTPIYDGMELVFKAPCNASEVTGLNLYYLTDGVQESQNFAFADANANDTGHLDSLFAEGAVVKVILDLDTNMAFVQNADTNVYLEERLTALENAIASGGGGGSVGSVVLYTPQKLNDDQKAQARDNIGAADAEAIGDIANALDELHAYAQALIGGEAV